MTGGHCLDNPAFDEFFALHFGLLVRLSRSVLCWKKMTGD